MTGKDRTRIFQANGAFVHADKQVTAHRDHRGQHGGDDDGGGQVGDESDNNDVVQKSAAAEAA